ncbi:MAG: hypothetical protein ACRC4L_04000, partial [Mycoplasma sp.]
ILPSETIANGSVALLYRSNNSSLITSKDILHFETSDFNKYYAIARNFGTRTLNIDKNSVFYFGLKKRCTHD